MYVTTPPQLTLSLGPIAASRRVVVLWVFVALALGLAAAQNLGLVPEETYRGLVAARAGLSEGTRAGLTLTGALAVVAARSGADGALVVALMNVVLLGVVAALVVSLGRRLAGGDMGWRAHLAAVMLAGAYALGLVAAEAGPHVILALLGVAQLYALVRAGDDAVGAGWWLAGAGVAMGLGAAVSASGLALVALLPVVALVARRCLGRDVWPCVAGALVTTAACVLAFPGPIGAIAETLEGGRPWGAGGVAWAMLGVPGLLAVGGFLGVRAVRREGATGAAPLTLVLALAHVVAGAVGGGLDAGHAVLASALPLLCLAAAERLRRSEAFVACAWTGFFALAGLMGGTSHRDANTGGTPRDRRLEAREGAVGTVTFARRISAELRVVLPPGRTVATTWPGMIGWYSGVATVPLEAFSRERGDLALAERPELARVERPTGATNYEVLHTWPGRRRAGGPLAIELTPGWRAAEVVLAGPAELAEATP